ncbi:hypothetical protein X925_06465 [Petrotoga sp. 9T1HF07.CasAA.8.2]|nr:hypothetical protein X925_06465 [Petrotoga sp. 9T1HF07.CasAA.8.2]
MRNFALLKCQAPLRARDSLGPPLLILLYNFKNVNCAQRSHFLLGEKRGGEAETLSFLWAGCWTKGLKLFHPYGRAAGRRGAKTHYTGFV